MDDNKPRRKKKLLTILAVVAGVIALLVILAPTLVSVTFGPSIVASALRGSLNGTIKVDSVRFGWTAPQSINGLSIDDGAGTTIRADASVQRSLLSLITNAMGTLVVDADADFATKQLADGSYGISKLAKPSPPTPSKPSAPLPSSFDLTVNVKPTNISIDRGADGVIKLTKAQGTIHFGAADGSVKVDLKGDLASSGAPGRLETAIDLRNLLDASQNPTIAKSVGSASIKVGPMQTRDAGIGLVEITVDARDPAKPIVAGFSVPSAAADTVSAKDVAGSLVIARDASSASGVSLTDVAASLERGAIAVSGGGDPFTASNLKGHMALKQQALSFDLAADTAIGQRRGAVMAKGSLDHAIDASMHPTLAQAVGSVDAKISRAVAPAGPLLAEVDELNLSLDAKNASAPMKLSINGKGSVREAAGAAAGAAGAAGAGAAAAASASTLVAEISAARDPASPIGISTDLRNISGHVDATSVPSAIVRPFVSSLDSTLPIDPARDLGPTLDVSATLAGGTAPAQVSLKSRQVTAMVQGTVDPATGAIQNANANVVATVNPALLAKTPISAKAPIGVKLAAPQISLPRNGGAFDLAAASVDVTVDTQGPVTVTSGGKEADIGPTHVAVKSAKLADGADVTVTTSCDGVPATTSGHFSGFAPALAGKPVDKDALRAKLTASVGPMDWSQVPRLIPDLPARPQSYGVHPTTFTAEFEGGLPQGSGSLKGGDGSQGVAARVTWDPKVLKVEHCESTVVVTDTTLDGLKLPDIRVSAPSTIKLLVEPFQLNRAEVEAGKATLPPITYSLDSPAIAVAKAPGLARPLTAQAFKSKGTFDMGAEISVKVDGSCGLVAPEGSLGQGAFHFEGAHLSGAARTWAASFDGSQLAGQGLLATAGVDPKKIPGILPADRGTLKASADSKADGSLNATIDLVMGALAAKGNTAIASNGTITVPAAHASITLDAARATTFFGAEHDLSGHQLITRATALPIELDVKNLVLPATPKGGKRPIAQMAGDIVVITKEFDVDAEEVGTVKIGALRGDISLPGGAKPIKAVITSSIAAGNAAPKPVSVKATVDHYADQSGPITLKTLSIAGEVEVPGLPTAIVDSFVEGDGTLTNALGPLLEISINAASPAGVEGGVFTGTIKSKYMVTDLGKITLDEGMITTTAAAPLQTALIPNPQLRKSMLKSINPILADIRTAGQPIMFRVNEFSMPADGDMEKLNSKFVVAVGDVELEKGDQILNMLQLVREDKSGVIPGNIAPLDATITDGRLEYENWVVSVGKYGKGWQQQLFFAGDITLSSTPPFANAITCDYPVDGVGKLAAGATAFGKFFGKINDVLDKTPLVNRDTLRVRVIFSGPLDGDKPLQNDIEPVLVLPGGGSNGDSGLSGVLNGVFGSDGILKIPGLGGNSAGSQGAGGASQGGAAGGTQGGAGDSGQGSSGGGLKGVFDDIFKKKK